ncbi:hypothetical protein [Companilactobacillus kimchiensis]|uniref:Uncharacterized protein n=1 Tax=Companilactobacillus kimchiensis TaxID=993692 RepID=A0A0R2LE22_9LACO|nr:hypothetical protein [Companilactobacillus kimchiensis]KRO00116.1 hypothetical protein IV57_GL002132 [Companilactobacillus kimchiensis]
MSKNIKYIGGAVALTLLATAPVVAPIIGSISTSTVVKADNNGENEGLTAEQMVQAFRNQFADRYIASPNSLITVLNDMSTYSDNGWDYFSAPDKHHLHDMQRDIGNHLNQVGGLYALKYPGETT